ncbi:MAG: DUF6063 family protein [Clostridium sp.]
MSNKIFYYLLKNNKLEKEEEDLYKSYSENENIIELVKSLGESFECSIEKYGGVVYLIPSEENDFLGFSKGALKKILCKSGANDKDYYLSQFIILTFLVTMYGGQGNTSNMRGYLKLGDFINIITEKLNEGAKKNEDGENGIAFSNILERFEALKSSDTRNRLKTTKEGFIGTILEFLEKQELINYVKDDEMIFPTKKLNNFMDWNLLNKNNYNRVLKALGEEENE